MKLTFLGTNSMVPTKQRNVVGHFLEYKEDGIMIDCGEGSQRQMNIAGINRNRVNIILLTHWHGDHVSGLIGLLQTIGNSENPPDLKVFGPPGTKKNLLKLMEATQHNSKLKIGVKELNPKGVEKFYEAEDYFLEAARMDHQIPTIAYRFVEKDKRRIDMEQAKKLGLKEGPAIGKLQQGKEVKHEGKVIKPKDVSKIQEGRKVSFILDTKLNDRCIEISEDADIVVCEATFHSELEDKAEEFKHLTARQAGKIAKQAKAKKLYITHFSQRYTNVKKLLEDARKEFSDTEAAEDLLELEVEQRDF